MRAIPPYLCSTVAQMHHDICVARMRVRQQTRALRRSAQSFHPLPGEVADGLVPFLLFLTTHQP